MNINVMKVIYKYKNTLNIPTLKDGVGGGTGTGYTFIDMVCAR